jgi:hypothetical protein
MEPDENLDWREMAEAVGQYEYILNAGNRE